MKVFLICVFLCGAVIVQEVSGGSLPTPDLYTTNNTEVTILDSDNFDEEVVKSDKLWVVQFYAPWCPHSKRFVKQFLKAAAEIKEKGLAEVGVINAYQHKEQKREYHIRGYPTVLFFGNDKTAPTTYLGARKSEKILEAVTKELNTMKKK